jgi:Tol biopolymer transport system component
MCALAAACGPPKGPDGPGRGDVEARIVAAERGRGGVTLVLVGETGERLADLTMPPFDATEFTVDTQPAWSADGDWVAFASTRGRGRETRIWIAPARAEVEPRPLTDPADGAVDRDPAWSPDGRTVVFSSNRRGTYDLWRVAIDRDDDGWPRADGEPVRITDAASDEVTPEVSPDGRALVYAVFDSDARTSSIWIGDDRGSGARQLTRGPLDQTPAWSHDGEWIAYSAPAPDRNDLDIFTIKRDGTREQRAIDEPLAHETEPAWSAGGRYLFAIAVLRNETTGAPFFWSVVFVDTNAPERVHALHDPAAVARVGFALSPVPLDSAQLGELPLYDADTVLRALRDLCVELPDDQRPDACKRFDR